MFRLLLSCVAISTILAAAPGPQAFRPPMVFEPNRGQAPASVKWIARASGYRLLLTTDGATIVLADPSPEAPKEDQVRVRESSSPPTCLLHPRRRRFPQYK